jgi:hypothetical protein
MFCMGGIKNNHLTQNTMTMSLFSLITFTKDKLSHATKKHISLGKNGQC